MKPWVKVLLVLGVLAVLFLLGAVVIFFTRPLAAFAWLGRRELKKAGLVRVDIETPAGRQSVFHGGSGSVLVLLHGAGDQAGAFSKVVPHLLAGHRLVIPDLAGHGQSEPASGPLAVETIFAALDAVLAAEVPDGKVTIVGNSLGAWMAALWAQKHPERVDRVVFVNGGPLTHVASGLTLQPKTLPEVAKLMDALIDPESLHPPEFVMKDVIRAASKGPIARMAQKASSMESLVLDGKLGTLAVPVEIVWGASDRLMPLSYAEKMLAELPAARLTRVEKCGHVPQQECPQGLLAALDGVLSQPPPARKEPAP
ncbi:MAG: alpha/beta hydrolase [Thermoanaerobaculia bacterium]|nr:alpha/beta hydrolase [Thermoanaerobaculia bacterium]